MATASTTPGPAEPRELRRVLTAYRKGDFTVRMPLDWTGTAGKIADTLNDVLELNEQLAGELQRVRAAVGTEGKVNERAVLGGAKGGWKVCLDAVNGIVEGMALPTTEVRRVVTAVAEGNLSEKMALDFEGVPVRGEFLRIATTVNTMVDQLRTFAAEVTRVASEVGVEGQLGGQAAVPGASGTWKDLTDNVNLMASNLTAQVRDIAEVTRVANEVGVAGQLGGQAQVPGVSGTWKDLTDNVNLMAANLTEQVRDIAEVTTAVATGDLGREITIDARGEVLELKNTINDMISQLRTFAAEVIRVANEVGVEGQLGLPYAHK